MSVLARVRNSEVREKKSLKNEFMGRELLVYIFMLTTVPTRARTRSIVICVLIQQNSIQGNRTYKRLFAVPRNLPY